MQKNETGKLKPNQSIRVKGSLRPKAKAVGAAAGPAASMGAELDSTHG